MAVNILAEVIRDGERLALGEDRRARVALLVRAVPVDVVLRQVELDLVRLQFCLLQADHVRVDEIHKIQKALADAGAQAVDIPRNEFHWGKVLPFR